MSSISLLNQYSNSGFYKAPVSKFLVGSFVFSHFALQVPAMSPIQRFLICKFPESLLRGDWHRIFTTKLIFLDTKDAIFCTILLYYFRIFERRLGSRKFCSQLVSTFFLSSLVELGLSFMLHYFNHPSGLLFIGPVGLVMPMLVPYFLDVPNLHSSTLGGIPVSSKFMTYMFVIQVAASSQAHFVGTLSAILSGILFRSNFLWLKSWFRIPKFIANITYSCFGRFIESNPPPEGMLGATLEIQRALQVEALEQQMIQQQIDQTARLQQRAPRAREGQGYAERLVDDHWSPFQNFNAQPGHMPQAEPTEENVRLLTDMGFTIDRARNALRETNNDLQMATTILLRDS